MIYIPQKLKVGFQNRGDTYTGKLAYIIYYDQKNKLRKEASWKSWRDKNIEPEEYDNVPTSGFVINKNAGGVEDSWSYDVRKTYVRVYDPRGFEFEITIPNLLFILENTSSIKGKGLEGEFVYGWDGTELVLIPTSSPDYNSLNDLAQQLQNDTYYLDPAELKVGYKYRIKHEGGEKEIVYMGKFNKFEYNFYTSLSEKKRGKFHFFFANYNNTNYYLDTITSMKDRILECTSNGVADNYADLLDKMEHDDAYSPVSKYEFVPMTYEEFVSNTHSRTWREVHLWGKNGSTFMMLLKHRYDCITSKDSEPNYSIYSYDVPYADSWNRQNQTFQYSGSLQHIFETLRPHKRLTYLENGNLYSEAYCR